MGLKDVQIPFNPDSEEDVRVSLALYFRELGFSLEEMSFEDSFQITLGHAAIMINKSTSRKDARARSDMLLTHNGQALAIVETKAPDVELSDDDRDQGLSYARLLTSMPPYTILTNGRELKVYDTITADLINDDSPSKANWAQNGFSFSGLSVTNHDWFIRRLLSLNYEVLQEYCRAQVVRAKDDLQSTSDELRRYSTDLYIHRHKMTGQIEEFLKTDRLCFGIIGESGVGKSNEMCAIVDTLIQGNDLLVLFYRGIHLASGLVSAIQNDFMWEFERDEPISRIIRRFTDLTKAHQSRLLIFIDGIDEYPGRLDSLRTELLDFVRHLSSTSIRLCLRG